MINKFDLTPGIWKKISAAGQSGTTWQKDLENKARIYISHTDQEGGDDIAIGSTVNLEIECSAMLPIDAKPSLALIADNGNDVFYATIIGADGKIITDMI